MELCLLREPDLALHSSIFISQMRIWALRPEFVLVSPKGPRSVPLALGQRGRRRSRPGRLRTRPGRARQRALAATRRTAPEKRKTSFPGCGREAGPENAAPATDSELGLQVPGRAGLRSGGTAGRPGREPSASRPHPAPVQPRVRGGRGCSPPYIPFPRAAAKTTELPSQLQQQLTDCSRSQSRWPQATGAGRLSTNRYSASAREALRPSRASLSWISLRSGRAPVPPVLPAASSPSHRRDAENVQPTSWRRSFLRHSPFPQRKSIWSLLASVHCPGAHPPPQGNPGHCWANRSQ